MKMYSWDEYYEKFYDWSESTQIRSLSYLEDLGDADEVAEIILELQSDTAAANRLLKKAVASHLQFCGDDLCDILCFCDRPLAKQILYLSAPRLTDDDMEHLYGIAEDEDIVKICAQRKLPLPADLRDERDPFSDISAECSTAKEKKPGFFQKLALVMGISEGMHDLEHRYLKNHNGRCNGDCANCPDHFGYRYGRWYYGKGHSHGCEFGGNKGERH